MHWQNFSTIICYSNPYTNLLIKFWYNFFIVIRTVQLTKFSYNYFIVKSINSSTNKIFVQFWKWNCIWIIIVICIKIEFLQIFLHMFVNEKLLLLNKIFEQWLYKIFVRAANILYVQVELFVTFCYVSDFSRKSFRLYNPSINATIYVTLLFCFRCIAEQALIRTFQRYI